MSDLQLGLADITSLLMLTGGVAVLGTPMFWGFAQGLAHNLRAALAALAALGLDGLLAIPAAWGAPELAMVALVFGAILQLIAFAILLLLPRRV